LGAIPSDAGGLARTSYRKVAEFAMTGQGQRHGRRFGDDGATAGWKEAIPFS